MQIVRVEQNSEEWLLHRLGKITGSKAKDNRPMASNKAKRYDGFWAVLAEKIAVPADGEPPMERGHRLENVALERLAKAKSLKVDLEPGMWISDLDEDIAVSPDGAEIVDGKKLPTFGVEVKCLSSASHLKYIVADINARKKSNYNPIYSVPNENNHYYRDQVIQLFVVNEKLKKVYFVLFDDRIAFDHLVMHVIEIDRSDVEDLIAEQQDFEMDALVEINQLVAMLDGLGRE